MKPQEPGRLTIKILPWLISATTVLWSLLLLFVITVLTWGHSQEITPDAVEYRLRLGMTIEQANFKLGLPRGWLMAHSVRDANGQLYANVSDTGILGEMFVPQHQITLVFGKTGRLESAYVEYHWRADEIQAPTHVRKSRASQ